MPAELRAGSSRSHEQNIARIYLRATEKNAHHAAVAAGPRVVTGAFASRAAHAVQRAVQVGGALGGGVVVVGDGARRSEQQQKARSASEKKHLAALRRELALLLDTPVPWSDAADGGTRARKGIVVQYAVKWDEWDQ